MMDLSLSSLAITSVVIACISVIISTISRKLVNVNGKHALITGGSSGIGKCCAIELVKRGANVTLVARDMTKLEEAKLEIEFHIKDKTAQFVNILSLDISGDYDVIANTVKQAEDKLGPVFILLNCAGFAIASRIEDTSVENMKRLLDVNFVGSFCLTKAILSSMKLQKEGHIVFTSSQAGLLGLYGYSAYSAAKFALRGLAETLQMEVKPYNIKVTLAFPPDTDTPGFKEEEKTKPEETRLISETGGLVSPESVASVMVQDVLMGKFFSSIGFDGMILSTLCAGFSPVNSAVELLVQVFSIGSLRIVAAFLLYRFNRIIYNCHKKRENTKEK